MFLKREIFLVKNLIDGRGREYRLVKTFKHERDAVEFTDKLERESRSKRFCPIIQRVVVTLLRDKWWKHSKFRVYVPVKWR